MLRGLLARARALFDRQRADRELNEELRFHLERDVERLMARGISREDAERDARLGMGNTTALRESVRDSWGGMWLEHLVKDLRYVARQARRMPTTTLFAVLTFAIGIGAATTIGTLAGAALWRTLPVRDPDAVVLIGERSPQSATTAELMSGTAVLDARQRAAGTAETAAYAPVGTWSLLWQRQSQQVPVAGSFVTRNYFNVLGVAAQLGRMFRPDEDTPVAIVSDRFWRTHFGGRRDVLGASIAFPISFTIVGVAPREFRLEEDVDVWLPLDPAGMAELGPDRRAFRVVGRRLAGVTTPALATRLSLDRQRPFVVTDLRRALVGDARPKVILLLAAVAAVVVLGCVNVATLLLDRAVAREPELALRTALGASPGRIVMQVVAEAVVLAVAGGVAGAALAAAAIRTIPTLAPTTLLWVQQAQVNWVVIAGAGALTLACGVLAGLIPARRSWRRGRAHALAAHHHSASREMWRLRRGLTTSQVAFAFSLLVATGLMVRSLIKVLDVDLGFEPRGVLAIQLSTDIENPDARLAFYQTLIARVHSLPGVTSVGATTRLPLREGGSARVETRRLHGDESPEVEVRRASGSYFRTMGILITKGRAFDDRDGSAADGVAIVNETAARQLWPGADPVGQPVRLRRGNGDPPWLTVVGVARDVRHFGVETEPRPEIYLALQQGPPFGVLLVTRARGDVMALVAPVRALVRQLDAGTIVLRSTRMESLLSDGLAVRRYTVVLLIAFGVVALVLAFIGVYATVAHVMRARQREVAIRMSLGATPASVLRTGLADALRSAVPGLALGALAGLGSSQLLKGLLFGIGPLDAVTFAAVGLGLCGVVVAAALVPVVRSARLDPAVVLRGE
jgi:putative ABC transport system permease protein